MSARQEIAEAAGASPYFTKDLSPGSAWVRLERMDYPNPFGAVTRWNVVVVLPKDLAAAEEYLDDLAPQMVERLRDVLPIDSIQPTQLELAGVGLVHTAFFTGHRGD